MRIVSWNVNGIRAVAGKGFLDWLAADSPDILCVQETKADPEQLSPDLTEPWNNAGVPYTSFWASAKKRGYSGVALYTQKKPLNVTTMGIPDFDDEGRVLQADFGDFLLINAYFPNSQEGGARLGYKLDFCAQMLALCQQAVQSGRRVLLCGDYNIAHRPIDLARPKQNEENPGYLPEERAWMDSFTAAGFIDTFRALNGDITDQYSWWSYRMKSREHNVGWRIDYHCVDTLFFPNIVHSRIRQEITGSDHCPVEIELKSS